jgi:hypothetical protein
VHAKWVRKRDGYVYAEVGGEAKWVRKREGSAFIRFKRIEGSYANINLNAFYFEPYAINTLHTYAHLLP